MAQLSLFRRIIKLIHPEAMRGIGAKFYKAVSASAVFQSHYGLVAEHVLSFCSKGNLLDIGTGPAWLLLKIHQNANQMHLVGIDPSPAMLEEANKNINHARLNEFIEIKEGSAANIPFTDESFDIVISTASIHHWKQPDTSMKEAYRVLKKGGYCLLYDVVSNTPKEIMDEFAQRIGRLKTFLFWLHGFEEPFYTWENFGELAQGSQFKKQQALFVGLLYCLVLKKEM